MFKPLQAYFKSENDAEDVRTKLIKLNVRKVMIDELPENGDHKFVMPLTDGGGMTTSMLGTPVYPVRLDDDDPGESDSGFQIILECQVEEKDLNEALEVVKDNGGHVDKKNE